MKKIEVFICILLCVTLILGCMTALRMSAKEIPWGGVIKAGDVNGDGDINAKDVTLLRRYLAGGWGVELEEYEVPEYTEPTGEPTGEPTITPALSDEIVVAIDEEHFPNEGFRNCVKQNYDTDKDGYLSKAEIFEVKEFYCSGSPYVSTNGCEGISYFSEITKFYQNSSYVYGPFDLSNNSKLEEIHCTNNSGSAVIIGSNNLSLKTIVNAGAVLFLGQVDSLESLTCGSCYFESWGPETEVNVSKCPNLKYLNTSATKFTHLDLSNNPFLETLICGIESPSWSYTPTNKYVNVRGCPLLREFRCPNFGLYYLDISQNTELQILDCSGNSLHDIDFSNNDKLEELYCKKIGLTTLDVSDKPYLKVLDCSNNGIRSLNLSNNAALRELYIRSNQITDLDITSNSDLEILYIDSNFIQHLDLSKNTLLKYLYGGYDDQIFIDGTIDVSNNTNLNMPNCLEVHGRSLCIDVGDNLALHSFLRGRYTEDTIRTYLYAKTIDDNLFPDNNFRNFISENIDIDGDGVLSYNEIKCIEEIDVPGRNITDLSGIEIFWNLRRLNIVNNEIDTTGFDKSNVKEFLLGHLYYLKCDKYMIKYFKDGRIPLMESNGYESGDGVEDVKGDMMRLTPNTVCFFSSDTDDSVLKNQVYDKWGRITEAEMISWDGSKDSLYFHYDELMGWIDHIDIYAPDGTRNEYSFSAMNRYEADKEIDFYNDRYIRDYLKGSYGKFPEYVCENTKSFDAEGKLVLDVKKAYQHINYSYSLYDQKVMNYTDSDNPFMMWGDSLYLWDKVRNDWSEHAVDGVVISKEMFTTVDTKVPTFNMANLCAKLSDSAYSGSDGNRITSLLKSLGFYEKDISLYSYPDSELNENYDDKFKDGDLAFSIASKDYGDFVLLTVIIRGTNNFVGDLFADLTVLNVGTLPVHGGIAAFYYDVVDGLNHFLDTHEDVKDAFFNKKLKMLVTGHSLGAGCAEVVGAKMMEGGYIDQKDLYVYTFASPNPVEPTADFNVNCDNIINFIIPGDPVPTIPPFYHRVGRDIEIKSIIEFTFNAFDHHSMSNYISSLTNKWVYK